MSLMCLARALLELLISWGGSNKEMDSALLQNLIAGAGSSIRFIGGLIVAVSTSVRHTHGTRRASSTFSFGDSPRGRYERCGVGQ
jgi:hypothetical protein